MNLNTSTHSGQGEEARTTARVVMIAAAAAIGGFLFGFVLLRLPIILRDAD